MSQVLLRPTLETDLEYVMAAERHPENWLFVSQWTAEQHREVMAEAAHFVVEDSNKNRVGCVIFQDRYSPDRCINLRRFVITEKGKGYGRAALAEAVRLAFDEWNAHRLWLRVVDNNAPARSLYRSAGFAEEGILRDCLYYAEENCFRSSVIMAMLEREYRGR